jgi:hypothetical protein
MGRNVPFFPEAGGSKPIAVVFIRKLDIGMIMIVKKGLVETYVPQSLLTLFVSDISLPVLVPITVAVAQGLMLEISHLRGLR